MICRYGNWLIDANIYWTNIEEIYLWICWLIDWLTDKIGWWKKIYLYRKWIVDGEID